MPKITLNCSRNLCQLVDGVDFKLWCMESHRCTKFIKTHVPPNKFVASYSSGLMFYVNFPQSLFITKTLLTTLVAPKNLYCCLGVNFRNERHCNNIIFQGTEESKCRPIMLISPCPARWLTDWKFNPNINEKCTDYHAVSFVSHTSTNLVKIGD